jgi:flagellar biosynthetic protein FlhB
MDSGSQDRNLPASERKLQKAREDGQVSRSEDLSHLAVLGAGALAIVALSPHLFDLLRQEMGHQLTFDALTIQTPALAFARLEEAAMLCLSVCAVFACIVMSASVVSAVVAGGWVASLTPVMPDFSRLNPLSGLSNLVSKKKMITTAKMVLITSILFTIATIFLKNGLVPMASLLLQPSSSAVMHLVQWLMSGLGLMLIVVLLAAMVDVPLQSYLHKNEMKMSHQEVKEEGKQSDGNPQIKQKLRQKQREIAQRASVTAVPKADFVVMNPTHFAVAIRYDDKTMVAPQVISKGTDLLALKIRDIAKNHSIPVLQSPMLARALYAHAELDRDIPSTLYTAVAQVLAYIYRLRAAMKGMGPMPEEVPQPFVPAELDPLSKTLKAVDA